MKPEPKISSWWSKITRAAIVSGGRSGDRRPVRDSRHRASSRRSFTTHMPTRARDLVDGTSAGRTQDFRADGFSEATLQAFVDGVLSPKERLDVEEFLAMRPDMEARVEAYRSQVVALNAAFNAEEDPLPASLAVLAARLKHRTATAYVTMLLGFIAILVILLLSAEWVWLT